MDYHNCIISFVHIVDRKCDVNWRLDGKNELPNLILVYEGHAYVEHEKEEGRTIGKGDLVYFPQDVIRKGYTFQGDLMKCLAIGFELKQVQKDGSIVSVDLPLEFIQKINDAYTFDSLRKNFQNMVNRWEEEDSYKDYELKSQFLLILKKLIHWHEMEDYNYLKADRVLLVIEYMKRHINHKLDVGKICREVEVSSSYLSRIFKETTGETIIAYFNRLKIDASKDYLAKGYSVSTCAKLLGINDVYYFSKLFKKYELVAPSYYAKRNI